MKIIDLRSDTVTKPSQAMREVMAKARVGDDVFEEDPSINQLQSMAAEMTGKEKALLVPSGTMANLIAILTHCQRGDEVILGDNCHSFIYEGGGMARFGGIQPHILPNLLDGTIDIVRIKNAIRIDDIHFPRTKLICLENTHNRMFGTPVKPEYLARVSEVARYHDLKIHVDGARIFNAAIALNTDVKELVKDVDSFNFCLSKGLACPVGSILVGDSDFIHRARYVRKALGGGMRQAGIIAAAGIYALENMVERLANDHENARFLAEGISEIDGLYIDTEKVSTDIVYFELDGNKIEAKELVSEMEKRGVLFFQTSPQKFRMVAHYGITKDDIDFALRQFRDIFN
ncbi:MAG: low-specificity L-threonine aldolase [Candidatus Zixiibacteriota bacterium]